ncbi:hypothetical protein [Streptomyces sp. ITFR-16]|uniref:hypothetical protein n=1 Tax=Streptomyces sp. ITFR-16 TaxID=3075198 RepID=UPI002889E154|nr:hypothetical protein [Streptomyces sp. ITFR-16]WNI20436.1 hypothetical protein RLT58_00190 [Streptomyces sp. ITFR-16]
MDCLFCGENRKMTKEHTLARWMSKEFPELAQAPVYSGSESEYDSPSGNGPKERIAGGRERTGPFTNQARVVCGDCNNGWMSGLEKAVREPLVRMIKGLPVVLTPERQKTVALWSAMKLMVIYFDTHYGGKRPPLEVIGLEDARSLYRDRALGPRMVMALSRYQSAHGLSEPFYRTVFERMDHGRNMHSRIDPGGTGHSYQAVLKIGAFVAKMIRVGEGVPMYQVPPDLPESVTVHPRWGKATWPPLRDVLAGQEWEAYACLPDETGARPS